MSLINCKTLMSHEVATHVRENADYQKQFIAFLGKLLPTLLRNLLVYLILFCGLAVQGAIELFVGN